MRSCCFTDFMSTEYLTLSKVSESGTNGSAALLLFTELCDPFITLFWWYNFEGASALNFAWFFSSALVCNDEKAIPEAAKKEGIILHNTLLSWK
jgi:hypothetical protein